MTQLDKDIPLRLGIPLENGQVVELLVPLFAIREWRALMDKSVVEPGAIALPVSNFFGKVWVLLCDWGFSIPSGAVVTASTYFSSAGVPCTYRSQDSRQLVDA